MSTNQIFVLDMGQPVRIYHLACALIELAGLKPNVDVDVVCTGLRPGEKLFEERLMEEEGLQKTPNGLISVAKPIEFDEREFLTGLQRLEKIAYQEEQGVVDVLQELIPSYTACRYK